MDTEKQEKKYENELIVGAAALAVGALVIYAYRKGRHDYLAQEKIKKGRDNLLPARPLPKEYICNRGTPGIFFGDHPSQKGLQLCKPANMDGHVAVIGESGSGKTSAVILPTIEIYPGPQFIIDVKGDLEEKWHQAHDGSGRKLKVFRPSASGNNPCWTDFFELMKLDPVNRASHARDIARSIIPAIPNDPSPFWRESAQSALAAAIVFYFDLGFSFANAMVAIGSVSLSELLSKIIEGENSTAKMMVKELAGIEEKLLLNIGAEWDKVSQMISTPAFLNAITEEEEREKLSLLDFALGPDTYDVIFEIPNAEMPQHKPLVLLFITVLMQLLARRREKTYDGRDLPPILLLLDEFPSLGNIPAITDGLNMLRSKGVTFLLCIQSLANLDLCYGESAARVILENLPYKVVLGASDARSQEFLSKLVGSVPCEKISATISSSMTYSESYSEERRPLIYPHAFGSVTDAVIISPKGAFQVRKHKFWLGVSPNFTFL